MSADAPLPRTGWLGRAQAWSRAGAATALAQAAIQALGFLAAVAVIRTLDADEYAYYTIALGALGALTVLSDGGAINGVLSIGGRHWASPSALGATLAAARAVRARLAVLALALALPATVLALLHQGASAWTAVGVAAALVPVFGLTVASQLLEVVPRLHQQIAPLQRLQVASAGGRIAALALALPAWPFAWLAIAAPAPALAWAYWRMRLVAGRYTDPHAAPDPAAAAELRRQVARTLPSAAYYALSGQLTVALIAIFGTTQSVATVGALTRLAMLLNVLNSVFALLVVPRFARLTDEGVAARRYWQSQLALGCCAAVPVVLLAMTPAPAIAILGPQYAHLEREAALMAAGSAIALLGGLAFQLGAVRSIVAPPALLLPWCIGVQALLIAVLPIETVSGVIWIGVGTAASHWALHAGWFAYAGRRTRRDPSNTVSSVR